MDNIANDSRESLKTEMLTSPHGFVEVLGNDYLASSSNASECQGSFCWGEDGREGTAKQ